MGLPSRFLPLGRCEGIAASTPAVSEKPAKPSPARYARHPLPQRGEDCGRILLVLRNDSVRRLCGKARPGESGALNPPLRLPCPFATIGNAKRCVRVLIVAPLGSCCRRRGAKPLE